jgi:hypothetical protein
MAAKHNNLFLFLALACFAGIILIFVFDGYIGLYDKLVIDNGQSKQNVEWDEWARQEKYGGSVGTSLEPGGQAEFTYTIENHRFSEYSDVIEATLWNNRVKVADLLSEKVSVPSFDKTEVKWTVRTADILPANSPVNQNYFYIVKIKRGILEREVNINIYISNIIKEIPSPASP